MKNNILTEEIRRINSLISINNSSDLIKESVGPGKGIFDEVIPGGAKTLDNMSKLSKTYDDLFDYSKRMSDLVPSKNIDDFIDLVGKQYNTKTVAPDMLKAFIANDPILNHDLMEAAAKIAEERVTSLMKNLSFVEVFNKAGLPDVPKSIKQILSYPVDESTKSYITAGLDSIEDFIIKNQYLKNSTEGKEILDQIVGKRQQIKDFDTFKPVKPLDRFDQSGFNDFKSNWTKTEVKDNTDQNAFNVIRGEISEVIKGLPQEFDPSKVQLGRVNSYSFIQQDESTKWLPVERTRTQIEVTLPNGKKTLMYSSSGANEGTTGKKAGEWFWIPGFAQSGWYIKTGETVAITKGGNKYLTDFAKYLETNSFKNLQTGVLPKTQNGFLSSKFGDTSRINWGVITNAKNISDYDVIIDNAMKTGDFSKISRYGFEEYGIPNFREYLMNLNYK